jgi:hypothetical protein
MANSITAGNSSNGGTAIVTDTSGTLEIKTGTGSGTTAISIDASQNVTIAGTITASGGVSGNIRSGTTVASTSGTSIDFTGLPTGLKRITVMFNGVSTSGTSNYLIQLGDSGGIENTGYVGAGARFNAGGNGFVNYTTGIGFATDSASKINSGALTIFLLDANSNIWCATGNLGTANSDLYSSSSSKSLSATLDRIRITTVNGTDTFDAGTINILYE